MPGRRTPDDPVKHPRSHILTKCLSMHHLHVVVAVHHGVEAAVEDGGEIEEILHPARHRGGSLLRDGVPVSDEVRHSIMNYDYE